MQANDVVVSVSTLGSRAQQIFSQLLSRNLSVYANNRVTKEKFMEFLARYEAMAAKANVVYPVMTPDELKLVWEDLRMDEELLIFLMELNAEFRYIFETDDNWESLINTIAKSCSDFVGDKNLAEVDPDIISMLPTKASLTTMLRDNNWLVILAMSRWTFRSIDLTKTRVQFVTEDTSGTEAG